MKKRICFVVSAESTFKAFLVEQAAACSIYYDVSLVANSNNINLLRDLGIEGAGFRIGIERKIAPWKDLLALRALYRLFRAQQFCLVHSVTPKAGLLAMCAGVLAQVPIRIHTFTGQVWVTRRGLARYILKLVDRITAACASHILVDSPSQRDFLLQQGVVSAARTGVLADGSVSGVDTRRFRPDSAQRARIRGELGLPEGHLTFVYLGRLNCDKGVLDLARAFAEVGARHGDVHLLLVGPDEEAMTPRIAEVCSGCVERVHFVGYTNEPQSYLAAADVFCLPSYREGFGTSIIEAAAVGLPAIASRIYGVTDAVEENVTGLLHPPGDAEALGRAMTRMIEEDPLRSTMGKNARARATERFPQERLTAAVVGLYQDLLARPSD